LGEFINLGAASFAGDLMGIRPKKPTTANRKKRLKFKPSQRKHSTTAATFPTSPSGYHYGIQSWGRKS